MNYNVFIRGIYSTALTKRFLDKGYNIIFPSKLIADRFGLEDHPGSLTKDIIINDRFDKEGVSVTVKKEVWEKVKDDFPISHKEFPDSIILSANFPLNSIHKGIVISSNKLKNFSLVRLMPELSEEGGNDLTKNFTTTIGRINRYLNVGKEEVFQVVFEDVGKNYAYLNLGYTVSGDYAVLMPYNKKGLISKKIKNKEMREKLEGVINKVSTEEFGILLRTAAQYASELEILKEIQKLREKYIEIEALINQSKGSVGPIKSDYYSFNIIFPYESKVKLDQYRGQVIPTLIFHHEIKAASNSNNKFHLKSLDLIENIMKYTIDEVKPGSSVFSDKINKEFISYYYSNLYTPKQYLNIFHYKLNGRIISLKPGIIKKIERSKINGDKIKIILRRNLSGHGVYDGLSIPIEEGDYAIGIYQMGEMYYETLYYSQYHELKGKYFNINTPIFLKGDGIHYVDLELDVIEPLNKERSIIDQEYLEKALSLGLITEDLYNKAFEIAEKIKNGEIKSELDKINGARSESASIRVRPVNEANKSSTEREELKKESKNEGKTGEASEMASSEEKEDNNISNSQESKDNGA
ncbi:MAG: ribonuclease E/G [Promethearchaeota archaeon]